MSFKLVLTEKATKDLEKLSEVEAKRIVRKLKKINVSADPTVGARHLTNSNIGDLRFRVGDYRMIGVVDDRQKLIIIVKIGHRREIYRNV